MSTPPQKKYDTPFKVAQIVGLCAIEGINVSESMKKQMACIVDGTLSMKDVKEVILAQYRKPPC